MNIGEVAQETGVSAKTIRYYEDVGILTQVPRGANGYRVYRDREVQSLKFIQRARKLGFSIKDVASLLELWNDRGRASADVKALALRHVEDIDARIREMTAMRDTLTDLTKRCHGDDRPDCPILADLARA